MVFKKAIYACKTLFIFAYFSLWRQIAFQLSVRLVHSDHLCLRRNHSLFSLSHKKARSRIHCQYAPDYRYVERRQFVNATCTGQPAVTLIVQCVKRTSGLKTDFGLLLSFSMGFSSLFFHGHNKTDSSGGEPITCVAGLQKITFLFFRSYLITSSAGDEQMLHFLGGWIITDPPCRLGEYP